MMNWPKKVTEIYYDPRIDRKKNPHRTGLVFVLEDGTRLHQLSCENMCLEAFEGSAKLERSLMEPDRNKEREG